MKIKRADKHIAELKEAILRLEDTYTSAINPNMDTGHQSITYTFPNFEDALLDLSPIVGDAIHNLHTALDFAYVNTIRELIPAEVSKYTKFPVYPTREELQNVLTRSRNIDVLCPVLFKTLVSEIQPYKGGQAGVIYVLHDLDISDKHILLLDLKRLSYIKGIVMRDENGETIHERAMMVHGIGTYIVTFGENFKIENAGKLSVTIFVKHAGIFQRLPVLDMLSGFSQYVLYVVELLESLCP